MKRTQILCPFFDSGIIFIHCKNNQAFKRNELSNKTILEIHTNYMVIL